MLCVEISQRPHSYKYSTYVITLVLLLVSVDIATWSRHLPWLLWCQFLPPQFLWDTLGAGISLLLRKSRVMYSSGRNADPQKHDKASSTHSQLEKFPYSAAKTKGSTVRSGVSVMESATLSPQARRRKRQRQNPLQTLPSSTAKSQTIKENKSVLMGLYPTIKRAPRPYDPPKKTDRQDTQSPYETCLSTNLKQRQILQRDRKSKQGTGKDSIGGILSTIDNVGKCEKRRAKDPPGEYLSSGLSHDRGIEGFGGVLSNFDDNFVPRQPKRSQQYTTKQEFEKVSSTGDHTNSGKMMSRKAPIQNRESTKSTSGSRGTKTWDLNGRWSQTQENRSMESHAGVTGLMAFAATSFNRQKSGSPWIEVKQSTLKPSVSKSKASVVMPGGTFLVDRGKTNSSHPRKASASGGKTAVIDNSATSLVTNNGVKAAGKARTGPKSPCLGIGKPHQSKMCSLVALPSPDGSRKNCRQLQLPDPDELTKAAQLVASTGKDQEATNSCSQPAMQGSKRSRATNSQVEEGISSIVNADREGIALASPKQQNQSIANRKDYPTIPLLGSENPGDGVLSTIPSCLDKRKAEMVKNPVEVIELSDDSSLGDESQDEGQVPMRDSSRRSDRQRQKPTRFCEEFIDRVNDASDPAQDQILKLKEDEKRLSKTNRKTPVERKQKLGNMELSGPNDISWRRVRRRSDRKSIKPLRFSEEFDEVTTDEMVAIDDEKIQHCKGEERAAQSTKVQGRYASGNIRKSNESHKRNVDRTASCRKETRKKHMPVKEKQTIFTKLQGRAKELKREVISVEDDQENHTHKSSTDGEQDMRQSRKHNKSSKLRCQPMHSVVEVIVIDDNSSIENGASSIASPEASALESMATGLSHHTVSIRSDNRKPRKRKVCYDQVEEAVNNHSLVQSCLANAPIFRQVSDQNTFVGQQRNSLMATTNPIVEVVDQGICCFDKLEIACGKTHLRMLAHLPPVVTELEEQSKLVPRHKNVLNAADPALQAQARVLRPQKPVFKRKADVHISQSLESPRRSKQLENKDVLHAWSSEDMAVLRAAYKKANAKSTTFWDDIAAQVQGKTALSCQHKWFSLAKTPPRKAKAQKTSQLRVETASTEEEDDLFNSTPMRGPLTSGANHDGERTAKDEAGASFPSFEVDSPIKFDKVHSDPSPSDDEESLDVVDFRFKAGYKTYIRDMKKKVRQSQQRSQNRKLKKSKKDTQMVSERFGDGKVEVRGDLSPGGTLKVQNLFSDDEDEMFLYGSDAEEDNGM